MKEDNRRNESYPAFPDGVWSYELFKNYPSSKVTICDIGSVLTGNFMYEEISPAFDWTIEQETQTILSYNCLKATTFFRGRHYIAWFAVDIPIPNGPWQFGNLPGMILKLYDTGKNFVFECIGIENLKNKKEPVKFYQVEYTKLSRKEYKKLDKRYHDDWIRHENLKGVEVILMNPKTRQRSKPQSLTLPYNPIELE